MGEIAPTPPSTYSANSQKINRFRLSQKFGNLAILIVIGIPLLLGGVAYATYKRIISPAENENNVAEQTPEMAGIDPAQTALDPNAMIDPTTGAPIGSTAGGGGSIPPQGSAPASSGQSPARQPAAGIPDGVVVAINSIEANGIKNNPYVSMDTSGIPDGIVVSLDRSSWSPSSADAGSVKGTITYYGTPYNGSVTFNNIGGTWKVVGYSLG